MDHMDVGRFWEENAEAWTRLARQGYDIHRDHLNTPAFLEMLPDVAGLCGLDIGCGEGHNTRLVAGLGARIVAFDIAPTFVRHAGEAEVIAPKGIRYLQASTVELPFRDAAFDFAVAFMSLEGIPETQRVFAEAFRVLRSGGFLQFSISHPCFVAPDSKWVKDQTGTKVARQVSRYFKRLHGTIDEWTFGAIPVELQDEMLRFRTPRFNWTLSEWLNLVCDTGFTLERVNEPRPTAETVRTHPRLSDEEIVPTFFHVRCRRS
jgi:ubiquinone/menaquinone biosynthesis C-methylase UbiE